MAISNDLYLKVTKMRAKRDGEEMLTDVRSCYSLITINKITHYCYAQRLSNIMYVK